MKRFFILTAILAVLGLSSCEKEPSRVIVGTWEAVTMEVTLGGGINMTVDMADAGMRMMFTFNSDGTGSAYMESEGSGDRAQMEYELFGNVLTMTSEGETSSVPVTIDGKSMTMEISGDFIGEDGSNIKIHFRKV